MRGSTHRQCQQLNRQQKKTVVVVVTLVKATVRRNNKVRGTVKVWRKIIKGAKEENW